jgi:hypothetical protein
MNWTRSGSTDNQLIELGASTHQPREHRHLVNRFRLVGKREVEIC